MILPKINVKWERWKFNKDYGVYVSTLGHFKDRYKREIPIKINHSGYCVIKTEQGYRTAHRLVMITWRPTDDAENLTVDHLDHNKRNNALYNLEWVSYTENQYRARNDFVDYAEKDNKSKTTKLLINDKILMTEEDFVDFVQSARKTKMSKKEFLDCLKKAKKEREYQIYGFIYRKVDC